jgi:uncharacterized membrane protein YfcA
VRIPARAPLAFAFAVPIAALGGLIGLGGAELRLPVLVGPLGYPPRRAVPLNLAVSVVTIAAALAIRARSVSLDPLRDLTVGILALIAGAVTAAVFALDVVAVVPRCRYERRACRGRLALAARRGGPRAPRRGQRSGLADRRVPG